MKHKFFLILVVSVLLVVFFALGVSAVGYMPSEQEGVYNIPVDFHGLEGMIVQDIIPMGAEIEIVVFTYNVYTTDFDGFVLSDSNTYSEYIGWESVANTQGTFLNSILNDSGVYSNWSMTVLLVNEYMSYYREFYYNNIEYQTTLNELDELNVLYQEKLALISQLQEELASGGTWNDGYNAGLNDSKSISEGLITLFTAPVTFLQGWFNFEIFGINFVNIIKFFVSVALVGWLFKRLREE